MRYAILMEEFPGYTVSALENEDAVTVEGLWTFLCAKRAAQKTWDQLNAKMQR